jgi:hypothetical protein
MACVHYSAGYRFGGIDVRMKIQSFQRLPFLIDRFRSESSLMFLPPFAQVGAEIPMDSNEADQGSSQDSDNGKTLLYVFERGSVSIMALSPHTAALPSSCFT